MSSQKFHAKTGLNETGLPAFGQGCPGYVRPDYSFQVCLPNILWGRAPLPLKALTLLFPLEQHLLAQSNVSDRPALSGTQENLVPSNMLSLQCQTEHRCVRCQTISRHVQAMRQSFQCQAMCWSLQCQTQHRCVRYLAKCRYVRHLAKCRYARHLAKCRYARHLTKCRYVRCLAKCRYVWHFAKCRYVQHLAKMQICPVPNKARTMSHFLKSYSKSSRHSVFLSWDPSRAWRGTSPWGYSTPRRAASPRGKQYTTDPQQRTTLDCTQTDPNQFVNTQHVPEHEQGERSASSGLTPPKKWRKHTHSYLPHSRRLLIPLESRLEDSPDHPRGDQGTSSIDSSKSESLSLECSEDSSPPREALPREQVPPASKILDTSLNFWLGHSGTQVMAQYSKPSPPAPQQMPL